MKADMHLHTVYSDGLVTAKDLIESAKEHGVELISVTDHDTMLASDGAEERARDNDLRYVRGMEVSAYAGDKKLHTLCYNPDESNPDFKAFLNELRLGAEERTEQILHSLKKCGVNIPPESVEEERFCKDAPFHVMHIARAGAKAGYAGNPFEFFQKYLAYGKAGFCLARRPSPERAVEIISDAGGIASVAHPARVEMNSCDLKKLLLRLKDCGLKGIEAEYFSHTYSEKAYYKELAKELDLFVTGGSDTHFFGGTRYVGAQDFEPDKALLQALGKR